MENPAAQSLGIPHPEPVKPSFRSFVRSRAQVTDVSLIAFISLVILTIELATGSKPIVTYDSETYIFSASTGQMAYTRPMGYSWFLQLGHGISPTLAFVPVLQYLLHAIGVCFLLLSSRYLLPINITISRAIGLILLLHPDLIYASRLLMSDSLFSSLTLIFFASALWILVRPNVYMVMLHLLTLALAVNIRYVGLLYVLLSVPLFLLSPRSPRRLAPIALAPLVIAAGTYLASAEVAGGTG